MNKGKKNEKQLHNSEQDTTALCTEIGSFIKHSTTPYDHEE